jgi:hypothetical protein
MFAPFIQLQAHFGSPARNHERVRRILPRNPAMRWDVAWCDEEEWSYQSSSLPRRLGPIKSVGAANTSQHHDLLAAIASGMTPGQSSVVIG